MFLSMTGFGSISREFSWGTVLVEASSVNHKYQEFSVRLPKELASLENRIINLMRREITRGKVRLSIEISWNPGANIPVLDEKGLINLINQVRKIANRNHLEAPADITNFLLIPGVYEDHSNLAEQEARANPEVWDNIIIGAIKSLTEAKQSEGLKLKSTVESDLTLLAKITQSLKERWTDANVEAIEGLRNRIESVMEYYNLEIDAARVAQEVSLLSDKWDVSEELVRLEAHTEKFRQVMELPEPSGKRLDFLIQEMNREINTMGSKVADAQFRWGVVEAKSCVERMREQIQNIE